MFSGNGLRSPQRQALLGICACLALIAMAPLVADGVYTKEQAERGHGLYDGACASCHGAKLEGGSSVPLTGDQFGASWSRPNLTLDDFYYIVRKTMPKDAPGSLTREEYADIVAYLLQQNGFPPGEKELTPDPAVLKTVRFGSPAPSPQR
jgi:mono/diheme cytochrome c family protein